MIRYKQEFVITEFVINGFNCIYIMIFKNVCLSVCTAIDSTCELKTQGTDSRHKVQTQDRHRLNQ
jgi:hypothetical protein